MSDDVREAIIFQAGASRHLGSVMYADLLDDLLADYDAGGLTAELLAGASEKPVHDAIVLRFLGAVHRVALRGDAPALADRYPSCGGDGRRVDTTDFLAVVAANLDEVREALGQQVQTNEVGRAVVLVALSHWLPTVGIHQFDLVEIGTSAGLNQNFDRLAIEPGDDWFAAGKVSQTPARCLDRCGCDVNPLDVADGADASRLESFVWPDQTERLARLRRATAVARKHPPRIVQASADEFLREHLAGGSSRPTVVFHSIVWQYLGSTVQGGVVDALTNAGRVRDVVWARMEPAGAVADVRVDIWRGGVRSEHRVAEVGYHGQEFRWLL